MFQAATEQDTLRALRRAQAVVFPTDTLYGLGLSIKHAESPALLYDIKQRDARKPIAWLVGGVDDLRRYGKVVPDFAFALARTFWPGPLTLIVRASDAVPAPFRSQEGTVGLRMPSNETALSLIRALGCPIATTSANVSGQRSASAPADLDATILSRAGAVLCDDEPKSGIASTIVDCSTGHAIVTREGAITISDIQAFS